MCCTCWICVCVHSPVQCTLPWDAAGFLWEWPTFHFWWIRHLLTVCLQFRKGGFREAKQKPEVLRGIDVEEEEGGEDEGRRETDVCLWDVCTLCINEPSLLLEVHPALQTIKGCDCHHDPLSLSHFKTYPSSRWQHHVAMAKPNNWQFVNRTMCVCFGLTTAFPPSVSPSTHPTLDREIACNWLWMDCGWQEGRAVCLL